MSDLRRTVEELNALIQEDELVDEFDNETVDNQVELVSDLSLTDELDAKTKISRCLDLLKVSLDNFKTTTMTEIDLIKDANISVAIEGLDTAIKTIEDALKGKLENQFSLDLQTSSSEDEEPEETETEEEETTEEESTEEPESEENEETEEEDEEEFNFDDEAELDLFSSK